MTSSHMFWFCHHLHQCSTQLMFHSHLASNGTTKLLRSYRLVLFVWVAYSALKGILQTLTQHATADWPPDYGVEKNKNLLHYFLMKHPDRKICPWCDHSISSRNWTVRTWLDWGPVFVWEEHEGWAAEWSLDIYVKDLGFHQKGVEWVTRSPWQRGPLQCRAGGECGL